MVLITGLLGAAIAPDPKMATLPAAMLIVGTASATIPAALWMQKVGRKLGIATGIALAIVGMSLACYAALTSNFWLLVGAMMLVGFNAAFTQQGRFIILENSDSEEQQADGLTLGLLANLFAAIVGPWLGAEGRDLIESPAGFAGSFLLAIVVLGLGLLVLTLFTNRNLQISNTDHSKRPLLEIFKQPIFLIAMGSAAIGYGVMSLVMTATPISMHQMSGHSIDHTRFVIQSHIVAMFLPSLLSGFLLKRGLRMRLIFSGLAIYILVVIIGFGGIDLLHYWWALVLLGLGWNLLFLTSTALLPQAYNEADRFKAQALNDFLVFSVQALSAFGAGWLLFNLGWNAVLWISLVLSLAWLIAVFILSSLRQAKSPSPS